MHQEAKHKEKEEEEEKGREGLKRRRRCLWEVGTGVPSHYSSLQLFPHPLFYHSTNSRRVKIPVPQKVFHILGRGKNGRERDGAACTRIYDPTQIWKVLGLMLLTIGEDVILLILLVPTKSSPVEIRTFPCIGSRIYLLVNSDQAVCTIVPLCLQMTFSGLFCSWCTF